MARLGQVVLYALTDEDAKEVNRRRADFTKSEPQNTGFQAHIGNVAIAGNQYPAIVVAVWNLRTTSVNLQVLLDGNDSLWVTSRPLGDGPGKYALQALD